MQERSSSLVFDQVPLIADTKIRENIQRALARMNIEDVDNGLMLLSKEFENSLKRYLLAARLRGKLKTTPHPDPDKWMLANMIECAAKHRIIVDRPTLAYLKEVRNERAHGPTPMLEEREILLRNIQHLAGLYIDYIKLFSDYTLQLISDVDIDEEKMLHISISDYMSLYGYICKSYRPMRLSSSEGASLETFVHEEIRKVEFADDCAQGVRFGIAGRSPLHEIDVALTYRGRLLIVECISGRTSLKLQGLNKLLSIAYLLGGDSVIKVYITDMPKTIYTEMFQEQTENLGIVVFTEEDLPTIGKLLEEQAKTPKYEKI